MKKMVLMTGGILVILSLVVVSIWASIQAIRLENFPSSPSLKIYNSIQVISFGGIIIALAGLLIFYRIERKTRISPNEKTARFTNVRIGWKGWILSVILAAGTVIIVWSALNLIDFPILKKENPVTKIFLAQLRDREMYKIGRKIDSAMIDESQGRTSKAAAKLINVIDRLDMLRSENENLENKDVLLFLSGWAKWEMTRFITYRDRDPVISSYFEKHRDEYKKQLYFVYNGQEFRLLIQEFPGSPWADDAQFALVGAHMEGYECEGFPDCIVDRSVGGYLPLIQSYPTSPLIPIVLNDINQDLANLDSQEDIDDLNGIVRQLVDYSNALDGLQEPYRVDALFPLAHALAWAGRYDLASGILENLQVKYPNLPNHAEIVAASRQLLGRRIPRPTGENLGAFRSGALGDYATQLMKGSKTERSRVMAELEQEETQGRTYFVSGVLSIVADRMVDDPSIEIRRSAIDVIGQFAPRTLEYQTALLTCLTRDSDLENRYLCATYLNDFQAAISKEQVVQRAVETVEAEYRAKNPPKNSSPAP
jgi:hypothetical protein